MVIPGPDPRLSLVRFFGLAIVMAALVIGYLRAESIRLPANIQIEMETTDLESIKIYYAINGQWGEDQTAGAQLVDGSQTVSLSLPLRAIDH